MSMEPQMAQMARAMKRMQEHAVMLEVRAKAAETANAALRTELADLPRAWAHGSPTRFAMLAAVGASAPGDVEVGFDESRGMEAEESGEELEPNLGGLWLTAPTCEEHYIGDEEEGWREEWQEGWESDGQRQRQLESQASTAMVPQPPAHQTEPEAGLWLTALNCEECGEGEEEDQDAEHQVAQGEAEDGALDAENQVSPPTCAETCELGCGAAGCCSAVLPRKAARRRHRERWLRRTSRVTFGSDSGADEEAGRGCETTGLGCKTAGLGCRTPGSCSAAVPEKGARRQRGQKQLKELCDSDAQAETAAGKASSWKKEASLQEMLCSLERGPREEVTLGVASDNPRKQGTKQGTRKEMKEMNADGDGKLSKEEALQRITEPEEGSEKVAQAMVLEKTQPIAPTIAENLRGVRQPPVRGKIW